MIATTLLAVALLADGSSLAVKPNFIFILCDDLGYGDVGCYGQQLIRTPNIDRLASDGLLFTDGYSGGPVCTPARSTLMLGLHNGHTPLRMNVDRSLSSGDVTLGEVLKHQGYRTAVIGKWGLGPPGTPGFPTKQGFDYFFGYENTSTAHNYYPEFLYRNEDRVRIPGNKLKRYNVAEPRTTFSNDLFVDEAKAFIAKRDSRPFFLYLPLTLPHPNNEQDEEFKLEIPSDAPYSSKPWTQANRNYAAMVHRIDRYVGEIRALLDENNLAENTLLIFTSDNGPHTVGGDHQKFFKSSGFLRGFKRDLYEGGIRVPFICYWPGQVVPGKSTFPVASWDFMATAAELAGSRRRVPADGISFADILLSRKDRNSKRKGLMYWEYYEKGRWQQAIRLGDMKAVRPDTKSAIEVYDLRSDPGERRDLAKSRREFLKRAQSLFKTARTKPPASVSPY